MNKAVVAQAPEKADALARELTELLSGQNRAGRAWLAVPSESIEVVITWI